MLGDTVYRYQYIAPNIDIEYRNLNIDIENDIISAFLVSTGERQPENIQNRNLFRKWPRRRKMHSIY